jgi:ribonucleoside-diphosphate reductase alpha chain
VLQVNQKAAKLLGINPATAATCGKPEGTTSQLTASGSGCHPWYANYFIRRYRINGTDPLFLMMKDQGFKFTPENGQTEDSATTWVVSFPCKAPEGAVIRSQVSAIDQLEWYKHIQTNWSEHNQSITVYVKDDEWLEVGNWVYKHWDIINGVSFLPYDNGHYQQAPYEEITEAQYSKMKAVMPKIDYSQLIKYEMDDNTDGAHTLACIGDRCELK